MLLAGEDTTANTLAWMIHLLQRHPAALDAATAEARSAGDALASTPERLAALDYLEACANETMRLKPVAPCSRCRRCATPRSATCACRPDTLVWGSLRSDSAEDELFADAPRFDPSAGSPTRGPAATSAKRVSMPFGAGPRICPGRYLALLEMKMAIAMLLGRFDIDRVDTPDGGKPVEHLRVHDGAGRPGDDALAGKPAPAALSRGPAPQSGSGSCSGLRRNPSQTTVATTSSAPATCVGAIVWPRIGPGEHQREHRLHVHDRRVADHAQARQHGEHDGESGAVEKA